DKLNAQYLKSNQKTFANPRNFVAGSIRQLNSEIAAARPLKIQIHSLGFVDQNYSFKSHQDMLNTFSNWNLPINPDIKLVNSINDVILYCEKLTKKRDALNYEIDGAVIKIDNLSIQKELGFSSRSPKWAIAKKFKAEEGSTQVVAVNFQMGRTGTLTPVAQLKPVKLGGVTISNATLHNMDEIERLDLRIGDFVKIKRAGDVIPKVIKVDKKKRKEKNKKILSPSNCPCCAKELSFFEELTPNLDLSNISSKNLNCYGYSQFKENLKHFVSRQAMDIDGLGSKTIDQMVDKKIIKSIKDLYLLNEESFKQLDGFAEKSINNLINSINKSKKTKLSNFIYALGIKEIGLETSKNLSKRFKTLENIFHASVDDFIAVDDIGEVASSNLYSFFSYELNKKFLREMTDLGFELKEEKNLSSSSMLLSKKIAITGKLSSISRDKLKSDLEELGVKVVSSISKNTDYIIVGDDAGSKLEKAKALNIEIIYDKDLSSFLKNNEN
ncbi:MAG: NAD-dependent DNA ligase LigA, partial [Gammaproteobacteria bacterium]